MLTPEELAQVVEALKPEGGNFHIDAEQHYNQHQRLDRFLDMYDGATSAVTKAFLGLFFLGALIAAAIGAGWHK